MAGLEGSVCVLSRPPLRGGARRVSRYPTSRQFIAFTPVVGVSTAQQQAVVQRVFWVWLECPVGHPRLARPAFCSGKRSTGPLSGSTDTFRRPL